MKKEYVPLKSIGKPDAGLLLLDSDNAFITNFCGFAEVI